MFTSLSYANPEAERVVTELRLRIATLRTVQADIETNLSIYSDLVGELTEITIPLASDCNTVIVSHILKEAYTTLDRAQIKVKAKLDSSIALFNLYQEYLLHWRLMTNPVQAVAAYHFYRCQQIQQKIETMTATDAEIIIGKPGKVGALLGVAKRLLRQGAEPSCFDYSTTASPDDESEELEQSISASAPGA